jgi:hypothetical protein
MDEQTRRLEARITDPRKQWKLSPMDLKSYSRWYDYSRARDEMFKETDTAWAPWFVANSNDKKRVRLNIISTSSTASRTRPSSSRRSPCPETAEARRLQGEQAARSSTFRKSIDSGPPGAVT